MDSLHAETLKKLDAQSAQMDKFLALLVAQNAALSEQMNGQGSTHASITPRAPTRTARFRHARNRLHSNQLSARSSRFGRSVNSRRPIASARAREARGVRGCRPDALAIASLVGVVSVIFFLGHDHVSIKLYLYLDRSWYFV